MPGVWIQIPTSDDRIDVAEEVTRQGENAKVFETMTDVVMELVHELPALLIFTNSYPHHGATLVQIVRHLNPSCHFLQVIDQSAQENDGHLRVAGVDGFLNTDGGKSTLASQIGYWCQFIRSDLTVDHSHPIHSNSSRFQSPEETSQRKQDALTG